MVLWRMSHFQGRKTLVRYLNHNAGIDRETYLADNDFGIRAQKITVEEPWGTMSTVIWLLG